MGEYMIVNAKENHITAAVRAYPWGVVTTKAKRYLTSWGEPPASAFDELHCALPAREDDDHER